MKDLKRYELETKENFTLYLRSLIMSTNTYIKWNKRYINELKEFIEKNQFDKSPKNIDPYIYIDFNNKIQHVSNMLLNLIGDETKSAMSYKKFRGLAKKRMEKGLDLGLQELTEEMLSILRQLNDNRNWSLHIPESLFTAEFEIIEKIKEEGGKVELPPQNPIKYTEFITYESMWLISLLNETEHLYTAFSKSFQQMKKDYSILIGEDMRVEKTYYDVRPIKDMDIPKISMEIQQKRYKGVTDPWIPDELINED